MIINIICKNKHKKWGITSIVIMGFDFPLLFCMTKTRPEVKVK